MFVRVIYGDSNEMLINPNCYIRLIYEYIKIKAEVPNEVEIDLSDGKGNLKKINEPPTYKSGLELLEVGETYYLVALKGDKKGRLAPVPLIDSNTAIYEILSKKFDSNKLSIKNLKYSNQQGGSSRRSKGTDAIVLTEMVKKKKKKKELKPTKSTKFPNFVDQETKPVVTIIPPIKDGLRDGRKVKDNVVQTKESKTNETLLMGRKNIWYLSPSGRSLREKNK